MKVVDEGGPASDFPAETEVSQRRAGPGDVANDHYDRSVKMTDQYSWRALKMKTK
jgi:hypothetical protein